MLYYFCIPRVLLNIVLSVLSTSHTGTEKKGLSDFEIGQCSLGLQKQLLKTQISQDCSLAV